MMMKEKIINHATGSEPKRIQCQISPGSELQKTRDRILSGKVITNFMVIIIFHENQSILDVVKSEKVIRQINLINYECRN